MASSFKKDGIEIKLLTDIDMLLIVCSYHVMYAFQSESTLKECPGTTCSKQERNLKFK